MIIGSGDHRYVWNDSWAKIPDSPSARAGWAHHGVVVSHNGDVISYHQDEPRVLVFDEHGALRRSWESGLTEAHGITLVREADKEYLWLADNGAKRRPNLGYQYTDAGRVTGQVVKTTLGGKMLMRLERPDLGVYRDGDYKPTGVAVNEERHGGNGDVWVADGYGQSYVHRYDRAGDYVGSITGAEGDAGRFNCPHAIMVDTRRSEPELYVADRSNRRVQVYDAEGRFKRAFGSDFLTSPSALATYGDLLVIAELRARLTLVDRDDRLVGYLGDNEAVCEVVGWPNNRNETGEPVRPGLLEPGRFNSPHGMAVDADGNIYVAEWLIGGRFTKLARL